MNILFSPSLCKIVFLLGWLSFVCASPYHLPFGISMDDLSPCKRGGACEKPLLVNQPLTVAGYKEAEVLLSNISSSSIQKTS